MGAFNVIGNFLGGYMQSRRQKQRDHLDKQKDLMDQAMAWSKIADTTPHDAVREMATKNLQDLIVQHEKDTGEKNGFAAILKLFKHDKPDAPALLNKIAPMLAKVPQLESSPINLTDEKINQISEQAGQRPIPSTEQSPAAPMPEVGEEAMRRNFETGAPEQPTIPTPAQEVIAPKPEVSAKPESLPTPPVQTGYADQVRRISNAIAPGKSVFIPGYSGGTRYSPSNLEIEAEKEGALKREINIRSEAEFNNSKRVVDYQRTIQEQQIADRVNKVKSMPGFAEQPKAIQERWLAEAQNIPVPQLTAMDLRPKGSPQFVGGKVMQDTAIGIPQDITADFRERNPEAAVYLDLTPVDQQDWNVALRKGAEYKKSMEELKKKVEEAKIQESLAQGNHLRSLSKTEREKEKNTTLALRRENRQSAHNELLRVDKEWAKELNRLGQVEGDEDLTSVEEKVKKIQKIIRDSNTGKPKGRRGYLNLDEYKKDFYEDALGGIDLKRIQAMAVTGVDPLAEVSDPALDENKKPSNKPSGPVVNVNTTLPKINSSPKEKTETAQDKIKKIREQAGL